MREKQDTTSQRFEALLQHHLQRRATLTPPLAAGDHLDDDTLAAFTEGRLSETQSTPVISHLISCHLCRHGTAQLLQLAAEMGEFEHEPVATPAPDRGRLRQLLDSLAARVLPAADDSAVFAYQARAEETQEDAADEGKGDSFGGAKARSEQKSPGK